MLKKSLLASIAFMGLAPVQATQMPHSPFPPPPPSHCPPCPCSGGVNGWVLIPAGPGMPCNQGASKEEEAQPQYEPDTEAPQSQPQRTSKRSLHPPRTAAQEHLEAALKLVKPKIYLRDNPNDATSRKEGEWGKELNGKVYFRHLGNWVHDPSVKPTDIANQGQVQRNKGFFEKLFTQQQQPQPQSQRRGRTAVTQPQAQPAPATQQGATENQADSSPETTAAGTPPPPPPPPPRTSPRNLGRAPAKRYPTVQTTQPVLTVPHATSGQGVRGQGTYNPNVPGAPGTDEARLNPVNRFPGE